MGTIIYDDKRCQVIPASGPGRESGTLNKKKDSNFD